MRLPLLVRYSTSEKGNVRKKALIYTAEEHGIKRSNIDPDALRITERLRSAGYSAFIVGGAVRDLLVGKQPKDFDVVTDAVPRAIKKLFRNCRIIGKRFRLAHIFFGEKIIEVATFRSADPSGNSFGTLEEDVMRRDFRVNALYYCPKDQTIIDYVGGVRDIRSGMLRSLIPLSTIFTEDPVRMIRAVKYSASTGFRMPFLLRLKIRSCANELARVSPSRITEELFKILGSGVSAVMFRELRRFGLLKHVLPVLDAHMDAHSSNGFEKRFYERLVTLDERVKTYPDVKRGRQLSFLFQDYFSDKKLLERNPAEAEAADGADQQVDLAFREAKVFLSPLVPPNREVEMAVRFLLQSSKKRSGRHRPRRPRRRKPAAARGVETPAVEQTNPA
jgi:poly(A) polymerase